MLFLIWLVGTVSMARYVAVKQFHGTKDPLVLAKLWVIAMSWPYTLVRRLGARHG